MILRLASPSERATRIRADAAAIAGLAAVYFAAAKLGLLLASVHASATAVWPPTGITLAAFLVLGYRIWPGAFLGALLANVTTEGSLATSLGIATGNTLEGLIGALLVNRFAGGRHALDRAADILRMAVLAALVSTTASATFGVTSLALGGFAEWARFGDIWLTWWLGDAAGALIVAPALLAWCASPAVRWSRAQAVEAALMGLSVALVGLVVFRASFPLAYLCAPLLMWPAFRFGQRETATAIPVLSAIAVWGTLNGHGPFATDSQNESLLLLQSFMAIIAIVTLPLGAVVAERRRAESWLRAAHADLEGKVEQRTTDLSRTNVELRNEIIRKEHAEQRFRQFLEAAPEAMVIVDAGGRIVLVNSQAEKLFGYRRHELLGRSVDILVPARSAGLHAVHRAGYFSCPAVRPMGADLELYAVRKNGTEFPVEISLSPLQVEEGILVSSAIRDITARKRVEQSLRRANEELRQAQDRALQAERLAAIGQMEAGLAHESRYALQLIQASVDLLARRFVADPEARYVAEIQKAEERLHRLFEDVRGYAAPVNPAFRLQNLADLWREAWEQTRPARKQRDSRLEEHADSVDLNCIVDGFGIERVFHNILLNALAACSDPVRIEIRCTEAQLDGESAIGVAIRDNGPGLTTEQSRKLFDPFYTTKTSGTGLGMTISKRIVEAHGGRIAAANVSEDDRVPGATGSSRGAEIRITLPRRTR